ncbi:MAG: threonine synthase [Firmicutes bacterium]|nr:threonine synthase [Bacillota bacterium]
MTLIERYGRHLPVPPDVAPVSLGEGGTPLLPSRRLGPALGLDLWFKLEGQNPTGSFKDRGMTVAVTLARARGARAVICASTGNTAASAAAYAARAGLAAAVVVPRGRVARGKLAQALACGAEVWEIEGDFDRALELVRATAASVPAVALVNSVNPDRLQGQKTAAFEICDAFAGDRPPDAVVLPVGNAGNITAYHMGFEEYRRAGRLAALPAMIGVQAAGAAPLVLGRDVPNPETVATAIRIGRPASAEGARRAVAQTGGAFAAVPDEAILDAQRRLAAEEGVFVEPASAAPVAALLEAAAGRAPEVAARVRPGVRVVCVLTGHGLKDPDAGARLGRPSRVLEAEPAAVARELDRLAGGGPAA